VLGRTGTLMPSVPSSRAPATAGRDGARDQACSAASTPAKWRRLARFGARGAVRQFKEPKCSLNRRQHRLGADRLAAAKKVAGYAVSQRARKRVEEIIFGWMKTVGLIGQDSEFSGGHMRGPRRPPTAWVPSIPPASCAFLGSAPSHCPPFSSFS
jgi:hypothetical protein